MTEKQFPAQKQLTPLDKMISEAEAISGQQADPPIRLGHALKYMGLTAATFWRLAAEKKAPATFRVGTRTILLSAREVRRFAGAPLSYTAPAESQASSSRASTLA